MNISQERWGGVVGKAVVSKSEDLGSSPTPANFFPNFFFSFFTFRKCGRPANAEDGGFFVHKILRIFVQNH